MNRLLRQTDHAVYTLIRQEYLRQKRGLELIASENFTSKSVLECLGSVFTNKYSEGQVGNRYYGGCDVVDKLESLPRTIKLGVRNCQTVNEISKIVLQWGTL